IFSLNSASSNPFSISRSPFAIFIACATALSPVMMSMVLGPVRLCLPSFPFDPYYTVRPHRMLWLGAPRSREMANIIAWKMRLVVFHTMRRLRNGKGVRDVLEQVLEARQPTSCGRVGASRRCADASEHVAVQDAQGGPREHKS